MELEVLGPLQVRLDGATVVIPGAKPRAILTMLGLHGGAVVPADVLMELLWGDDPPRTAAKALQTHISALRHALGDGFVLTEGIGWRLNTAETDASRYKSLTKSGRDAFSSGDTSGAVARFDEAVTLWRGIPELPDGRPGASEKTRWIESHAALIEDRADALLATGRAAEIIGDLEAAVADAPLRERRWGQLMLALYRAGRQGEALGAYRRARSLLADELGVDPGPELRRLEAAIVAQDAELEVPATQHVPSVTRAVTFLLTDIEGSTAAWEADADAMALALARHDELVEQVVTSRGGRLIKTRGEGDATFSVFDRPSAAAAAAIELQDAIFHEPWELAEPMRIRVSLHTGEAELRDGDYFGRAVNRAARLRSQASGGQILCSGATAELVIDSLSDDVVLADLGMHQLKNLARPEHIFELRLQTAESSPPTGDTPIERPAMPAVLGGPGPFVGRGRELAELLAAWQSALTGGTAAVLIAGEPGVGKTRLAGEWCRQAYEQGAVVLYGRSDEDLGAPYQPFAEALRTLVPCVGTNQLRGMRGIEALLPLVPGLTDVLPDLAAPPHGDPDTERYALFDAVVALLGIASVDVPIVLVLDDLHWAAKPTLLLLRHLLRFGEHARVQIIGTYRSTDLDRSHPLAAMLADLHRDGSANRITLGGLDENDVSTYVAEAGYHDEELARALASVTGGNPFFLIEALRHVDESGGHWDPSTLPQGVREAVSRRLSRLPVETNKALAAAAVVGSQFALELVEHVVGQDLVDAFDEACQAGIVIEEPGGLYRFNHAIVRQSLLAELASVRRMRLHQRIATTLETMPGADDELLAELAHHYFECAWAGNAVKAVEYCRRAADQAMARLAYEGAADLYDRALHALEELDDELPDRDELRVELLVARCEALLAAGDVTSAAGVVTQLKEGTRDSARLAAWATCFDGQLSMLVDPEHLDEIESSVAAAAATLAELNDPAGEAKAHTVRAGCLARLGRVADCEVALDNALTAARQAHEHRLVNAVLVGAPLAALWGPNPVPRAGGRCLDVVRLLRITTDSPAVEATSTRCQAVLEAFRGRAAAARRMIDSARRTVTELGLRHALLEVEHFAGIVELVLDDPDAAELHLRLAYNGFRRMGLDADAAETAALLARACLLLDRDVEADELCSESERLAGHALKASITWRTVRAQLLARRGAHDEARRVAEEAVAIAERTDALVDHGDARLALATVLGDAGDVAGARAAAERAAELYELKGAVALVEKARDHLGMPVHPAPPAAPAQPEAPVEIHTAAIEATERATALVEAGAWDEFERMFAPEGSVESRRKLVGFERTAFTPYEVMHQTRCDLESGVMRADFVISAVRGEQFAIARVSIGTADESPGAPEDEFLQLYGIDEEGRIALQIWFDLDDMDAALAELDAQYARFEQERSRASLENSATQINDRINQLFAAGRWDEIGPLFADGVWIDDRRRGIRGEHHGRAGALRNIRAVADLGAVNISTTTLAVRGQHLCLSHANVYGRDGFDAESLNVTEVVDGLVETVVAFDVDDLDAAIADLDARYVAGEAAPCSETWSAIARALAAFNRREMPEFMPDWVNIDHRRARGFAPGDLTAYIRATWDLAPDVSIYAEAVLRLSSLGAVFTHAVSGRSQDGFDAEWREICLANVEGNLLSRIEMFDEADLDAALARFDELSRSAPKLENTANRRYELLQNYLADRDLDAIATMLADDFCGDDRRQFVGSGVRHGRVAALEDARAAGDIGVGNTAATVVATRGERLVLRRSRYEVGDEQADAFQVNVLEVVVVDADERISALVTFDPDDLDAAFAELDARYLAGEAAPHAQTWLRTMQVFAALNRRELFPTTPDWVNIDHRRGTPVAPGEMPALLSAAWTFTSDLSHFVDMVHRLNNLGAVYTYMAHETSQDGFHAEWRAISVITFEGDLVNRCEVFDEEDLDAALARFEELLPPVRRLGNTASRTYDKFNAYLAGRDWDAMAAMIADDALSDDRRRVINSGIQRGRDAQIANLHAVVGLGVKNSESVVVATRGDHLALTRVRVSGGRHRPEAFGIELLTIIGTRTDNRITTSVLFDPDDFDAASTELEARYLAGEAAPHAHSWSAVVGAYAALNRREMPPTTADHVSVDHRRVTSFAPGDIKDYTRRAWDQIPDISFRIEAVHRLNDRGAVVTHALHGTSREGFEAEWREIHLMTLEGELFNCSEMFDEEDLDAALTRFDELSRPTPHLENAASQVDQRFWGYFPDRTWHAMAEILTEDFSLDDRRQTLNAGLRKGRETEIENVKVIADVTERVEVTANVIATRGERLALRRLRFSGQDQQPDSFYTEMIGIVEIDANSQLAAHVVFDPDDIDSAFAELDARYLAGEAAAHARTWSVITGAQAAFKRHEIPATTPNMPYIDHRPVLSVDAVDLATFVGVAWAVIPEPSVCIEAVHRLTELGAVVTQVLKGTSREDFDGEWRLIDLFTVEGNLISRCEVFDESDLDAALTRFDELSHPTTPT
ncbi:BTAD domain-containing putative transcriptional regulator [Mycobacterium sp. DL99]|uniref:BTAD domain-containing putative transcriptional regulator n=1 Tax=Mycobacterium sp. DL99 TaxID=2528957 RepID=UPI0010819B33|nr:BTAD domain-containing putative transcriptional regulator [Mycobacterium sp. DL99]